MLIPFELGFTGAGRPERDPRIEAVASASWKQTLEQQGQVGYAGDDQNPRELPRRTLATMREGMQDVLAAQRDDGTRIATLGLYLSFCDEAIEPPGPEVIPVPREQLWWLAAPGDLLLLTDGVTTHFATLLHASEAKGRMQIVDEWPARVFLREGFNEADVAARVQPFFAGVFESVLPGKLEIDLSRDEFLRVAVGLVTLDTPALIDRWLDRFAQCRGRARVHQALGRALMAPSDDDLAPFAAPHFARAERAAAEASDAAAALEAAVWSFAAHTLAAHRQRPGASHGAHLPFERALDALRARHGEARLVEAMDTELLIRLGNGAAWAQDFDAARLWLDRGIARDPFHDAAHWLRARVHAMRGEPQAAVTDATEALARNQAWIDRRIAEHDARDPRDHYGRKDDQRRIAGLLTRRVREFQARAAGLAALGRLDEAESDLREALTLRPEDDDLRRGIERMAQLRARDGAST